MMKKFFFTFLKVGIKDKFSKKPARIYVVKIILY